MPALLCNDRHLVHVDDMSYAPAKRMDLTSIWMWSNHEVEVGRLGEALPTEERGRKSSSMGRVIGVRSHGMFRAVGCQQNFKINFLSFVDFLANYV